MHDLTVLSLVLSGVLNFGLAIAALGFGIAWGNAKGELKGRRRHKKVTRLADYGAAKE